MKALLRNTYVALFKWLYYRLGWLRGSWSGVHMDWSCRISPYAQIKGVRSIGSASIGRTVVIGAGTYLSSGLIQCAQIGNYCSIGPDVIIGPSEHRLDYWTTSPYESMDAGDALGKTEKSVRPAVIGNGVWVGTKVIVLQGVSIGDNSVIAAGAVVTHNVPPNEIWGGVPARKLRNLKIDVAVKNEGVL